MADSPDSKPTIGNEILWQRLAEQLIVMRDTLVRTSEEFRDLMAEMDTEGRQAAEKITKEVLEKLKR